MSATYSTRAVAALKIHCPVDEQTLELVKTGAFADMSPDCALARIIAIVRGENPLGDFGLYTAVIELSTGWELFTPQADARPALGKAGTGAVSPTAILTIHIPADADEGQISLAIDAILQAHPWEVPVIEVTKTELIMRGSRD